jgi:hypothetical protein
MRLFPVFVKHELKGVLKYTGKKVHPQTVTEIIDWPYSNYFVFHILILQKLCEQFLAVRVQVYIPTDQCLNSSSAL